MNRQRLMFFKYINNIQVLVDPRSDTIFPWVITNFEKNIYCLNKIRWTRGWGGFEINHLRTKTNIEKGHLRVTRSTLAGFE